MRDISGHRRVDMIRCSWRSHLQCFPHVSSMLANVLCQASQRICSQARWELLATALRTDAANVVRVCVYTLVHCWAQREAWMIVNLSTLMFHLFIWGIVSTFRNLLDSYVLSVYLVKIDDRNQICFFKYMTKLQQFYQVLQFIDLNNILSELSRF